MSAATSLNTAQTEQRQIKRLKYLCGLINEKSPHDNDGCHIDLENIESWTGRLVSAGMAERDSDVENGEVKRFKAGDVLFNKLRPYLAKVYKADSDGTCGGELLVLRPRKYLRSKFLFYRMASSEFINLVDGSTYGTKMPRASWDFIGNLSIEYPDREKQKTIEEYLDRKTNQMDALIAKKERMVELLKEERAAVIKHAVTRGLEPKAEFEDMGAEWLGKAPQHWQVLKFKYLLKKIIGGGTPDTNNPEYWNGNIPWVSPKDMKVDFITDAEDKITEVALRNSATCMVPERSILIVVRSGILKHSLPVAISGVPVALNQDMKALIPVTSVLRADFLFWQLCGLQEVVLTFCTKLIATVDSIEMKDLLNLPVPVPPLGEQSLIATYLTEATSKIDLQVTKLEQSVKLCKEYRAALISEAVAGKIGPRDRAHAN